MFPSQKKQVWRKDLITVISNPLVSDRLEVVGREFCLLDPATSNQCRQNSVPYIVLPLLQYTTSPVGKYRPNTHSNRWCPISTLFTHTPAHALE